MNINIDYCRFRDARNIERDTVMTCVHFYHSGLCHVDSRHPVCPIVTSKPPPAVGRHNGASIFGSYFSLFYGRIGWKARNSLDNATTCTFFSMYVGSHESGRSRDKCGGCKSARCRRTKPILTLGSLIVAKGRACWFEEQPGPLSRRSITRRFHQLFVALYV